MNGAVQQGRSGRVRVNTTLVGHGQGKRMRPDKGDGKPKSSGSNAWFEIGTRGPDGYFSVTAKPTFST
jgi:hypothetical protein